MPEVTFCQSTIWMVKHKEKRQSTSVQKASHTMIASCYKILKGITFGFKNMLLPMAHMNDFSKEFLAELLAVFE